jgi:hypothetical protein
MVYFTDTFSHLAASAVFSTILMLANAGAPPLKNILFILVDDLGWNDVSWHNPIVRKLHALCYKS